MFCKLQILDLLNLSNSQKDPSKSPKKIEGCKIEIITQTKNWILDRISAVEMCVPFQLEF